jgi:hypothetical protein
VEERGVNGPEMELEGGDGRIAQVLRRARYDEPAQPPEQVGPSVGVRGATVAPRLGRVSRAISGGPAFCGCRRRHRHELKRLPCLPKAPLFGSRLTSVQ